MSAWILAGCAVAGLVIGWTANATRDHWRKAGRDLDRLSDLSDNSVDPDWPDVRKTMGEDDEH